MIHWFDIFVTVFLIISITWSYFRGITKEVFSIASIVIGYLMASTYYDDVQPWTEWLISDKATREIVAFALLFFVTIIVLTLFGFFMRRVLPLPKGLGAVNRIAGSGMGLIKGVIILSVIAFPLALIPGLQDDLVKNSKTAAALVGISGAMLEKLAPDLAETINESGYLHGRNTTVIDKVINELNKVGEKVGNAKDAVVDATKQAGEMAGKAVDGIKDKTGQLTEKAVEIKNKITESDKNELDQLIEEKDSN